ncbi:MAG: 9-O-acetylesterase, partial [Paludibacter sp.]
MKKRNLLILALALSGVFSARMLAVKPNSLFTDNAVFQRGVEVPVWGTGDNDEKVSLEFNGQKLETTAKDGKWMLKLKPMKENSTAQNMVITGKNTVIVKNILIGEVWLCSGQSNMAFPLRATKALGNYPKIKDVLRDAQNYPLIRQFKVPLIKNTDIPAKVNDTKGKWSVCDSLTSRDFSAVAYFMAVDLFKKLNVPIGIVNSSYGGTAIENWISKENL